MDVEERWVGHRRSRQKPQLNFVDKPVWGFVVLVVGVFFFCLCFCFFFPGKSRNKR